MILLKNSPDVSAYTLPLSHFLRRSRTKKTNKKKDDSRVFRLSTRSCDSSVVSPPPLPPDSGIAGRAGRRSSRFSLPRLPQRGVHPRGAPVLSEPLDVPVFLAQDGDLVLEEDGVQPHLGVDQRHGAKPAGELVHAGLPLGKVVGVGPARGPRRLEEEEREGGEEEKNVSQNDSNLAGEYKRIGFFGGEKTFSHLQVRQDTLFKTPQCEIHRFTLGKNESTEMLFRNKCHTQRS